MFNSTPKPLNSQFSGFWAKFLRRGYDKEYSGLGEFRESEGFMPRAGFEPARPRGH